MYLDRGSQNTSGKIHINFYHINKHTLIVFSESTVQASPGTTGQHELLSRNPLLLIEFINTQTHLYSTYIIRYMKPLK